MSNSQIHCLDPFVHVDIIVENENIYYKPCTVYNKNFISYDFNEVKSKMYLNQWIDECSYCQTQEKYNLKSRRIGTNQRNKNANLNKLQSIALRYGTLCNSTCIICDESRSSAWATKKMLRSIPIKKEFKFDKSLMPTLDTVFKSLNTNLSEVSNLEFHGGEPLMNSYPWEALDFFDSKNLCIKINTNGTIWPEKMKKFADCKKVEICFSIDDIHERLEFLRPPAKFDQIETNIKKSKLLKFETSCTYTLSALNIFYLPEFLTWALKTFGTKIIGQTLYNNQGLELRNMPQQAKEATIKKFKQNSHLGKILNPIIDEINQMATAQTDLYLYLNDEKFIKIFPEWSKILQNE